MYTSIIGAVRYKFFFQLIWSSDTKDGQFCLSDRDTHYLEECQDFGAQVNSPQYIPIERKES